MPSVLDGVKDGLKGWYDALDDAVDLAKDIDSLFDGPDKPKGAPAPALTPPAPLSANQTAPASSSDWLMPALAAGAVLLLVGGLGRS